MKLPDDLPEGTIEQFFTIKCSFKPGAVDAEGKPVPARWEFTPEGTDITPLDCIALALEGARWALHANEMMRAKAREIVEGKKENRLILSNSVLETQ